MMLELDPDSVWSHGEPSVSSGSWNSQGPTLSNDIWSKFDMLLTPPRTPLRDADCIDLGSLPEDLNVGSIDLPLLEEDDLEVNLDLVDLDANLSLQLSGENAADFTPGIECSHGQVRDLCTSCQKLALAGSELRHDCMWTGTCSAEAHANQKNRIHHDSTCSHISDLLLDSQGSLEVVARFTQLDDFRDHDDEDEDSRLDHDDDILECNAMPRPETPSESSETDSDEEMDRDQACDDDDEESSEEVVYTSGSPASSGIAHNDHTYHCMPPPSPKKIPLKTQAPLMPSYLHTPSDSEDEIDVVSVSGSSKENAYSCSTRPVKRSNNNSNNSGSNKRSKSTILTNTSSDGSKKIFRIHTFGTSVPSALVKSNKKTVHESPAEGVKLKARRATGKVTTTKRHHHQQQQQTQRSSTSGGSRKRGSPRVDSDDPEKREMHNSLERLRRVDLRNAFEELRVLIPDLAGKDKSPKVEILKKAAQYCNVVQNEERTLLAQLERQRKYNSSLIKRLHALQRR